MEQAIDIFSMGEPMIEFNQMAGGDGSHFIRGVGGDTSNFAIAAARQGASAGYISAIGDVQMVHCCASYGMPRM